MRRWVIRLLVLAALVAVALVLRVTVFGPQPVPVRVVSVATGRVEATVTNTKAGTIMARRRARLSPETGGRVVAIPHREGAVVGAGDVLLRLDDSSQRARLELARRELAAAEADQEAACRTAVHATREWERNRSLAQDDLISEDLLDRLEGVAEAAEARCAAAQARTLSGQAAIEVVAVERDKMVITAPFAGVVAEMTAELGEWLTPSPPGIPIPSVIDLLDPGSIYISAPMDEVDSASVRTGQPVKVTLDPYPGQSFPASVVRVAPYVLDVEAQNRTVEIEVELEDEAFASTLLPGTSADVEVVLEVRENVLRIPTPTLLAGNAVLVVEAGRLTRRAVVAGLRNWDYTEIVDGLAAGEEVVRSLDRAEVKPGALARVEPDPEP